MFSAPKYQNMASSQGGFKGELVFKKGDKRITNEKRVAHNLTVESYVAETIPEEEKGNMGMRCLNLLNGLVMVEGFYYLGRC